MIIINNIIITNIITININIIILNIVFITIIRWGQGLAGRGWILVLNRPGP